MAAFTTILAATALAASAASTVSQVEAGKQAKREADRAQEIAGKEAAAQDAALAKENKEKGIREEKLEERNAALRKQRATQGALGGREGTILGAGPGSGVAGLGAGGGGKTLLGA
jgi:hypothetical protein